MPGDAAERFFHDVHQVDVVFAGNRGHSVGVHVAVAVDIAGLVNVRLDDGKRFGGQDRLAAGLGPSTGNDVDDIDPGFHESPVPRPMGGVAPGVENPQHSKPAAFGKRIAHRRIIGGSAFQDLPVSRSSQKSSKAELFNGRLADTIGQRVGNLP